MSKFDQNNFTDEELAKQLQELPNALPRSQDSINSQWSSIRKAIELSSVEQSSVEPAIQKSGTKNSFWWASSIAAVLVLAFIISGLPRGIDSPDSQKITDNVVATDKQPETEGSNWLIAQKKTIRSLEQANGQYYLALGSKMKHNQSDIPQSYQAALDGLQLAKKQYISALNQSPNNIELYKKLINSYSKERALLKQLLA